MLVWVVCVFVTVCRTQMSVYNSDNESEGMEGESPTQGGWERHGMERAEGGHEGIDIERIGGWTKLSVSGHSGLSAIWWRWSEVLKINNLLDVSSERFDHWVPEQGIHLRCGLNILWSFPKPQSISLLLWQQPSKMKDNPEQDAIRSGLKGVEAQHEIKFWN